MYGAGRLIARLRSPRGLIGLGLFAPLGMLLLSSVMLMELRQDAWEKAERTSRNLLQVIERDIARNVEIIDLSLRAVIDNLRAPGLDDVSPELRQLVLFDRATSARDMGVMLVLDANGDSVLDSQSVPARRINNADRGYFQAHKTQTDLGLHISPPLRSRLLSVPIIVLSRRFDNLDGSFGGVVLASLKLSYFQGLFDRIGLGQEGGINLYLRDGTRLARYPGVESDVGANIAHSPMFNRFLAEGAGSLTTISIRDGIERFYTFSQVGDLPLVLDVALSTREIEEEWRVNALTISAALVVLCGLTILLSLLLGRELRRSSKMQAELRRLSGTDALTGLPNRRRYEEAFDSAWRAAQRDGTPLTLLIIDADHFKRYNDAYGHAVGDAVLKFLAKGLSSSVLRPNDVVARVGGEEFAVLMPCTDQDGALRVAERIHETIARLDPPTHEIARGTISVSIGLASSTGCGMPDDLYRRADAALYQAKLAGRRCTQVAASEGEAAEEKRAPETSPDLGHGSVST